MPSAVVQATRGGQSCSSAAWPVSGDGVENQSTVCQSCLGGPLVWSGCRTRMPQGCGEVTRGPAGLASVPMLPIGLPIREERQILTSLAGGAGRGDSHFVELLQKPRISQLLLAGLILPPVSTCLLPLLSEGACGPACLWGKLKCHPL